MLTASLPWAFSHTTERTRENLFFRSIFFADLVNLVADIEAVREILLHSPLSWGPGTAE